MLVVSLKHKNDKKKLDNKNTCLKSDVLLFPPAFVKTVFASSNMKYALASEGWLGTVG